MPKMRAEFEYSGVTRSRDWRETVRTRATWTCNLQRVNINVKQSTHLLNSLPVLPNLLCLKTSLGMATSIRGQLIQLQLCQLSSKSFASFMIIDNLLIVLVKVNCK